ncbi:DUF1553 domain-containing protein [Aureliella helgolandensis]|uniref:Planctomycete cytochrome C n=1 Tax=Aureliella helgolandensis TaxID=2527968 RepID=A0A518GG49_9BACT|nr:DUF1553 domain-containing protein [Aureliella helgolandensis]QDV27553.1 Planctomycete cytochrome C [Aureliella helgolandensis]
MQPLVCAPHASWIPAVGLVCCLAVRVSMGAENLPPVDFGRDIRPILSEKCFTCHGPDGSHREADLRLDILTAATETGIITPGHPAQSSLIERVGTDAIDERMPPPEAGTPLSSTEVALLARWIEEGAVWQEHWAFIPPVLPAQPFVNDPQWCRNQIDTFVLARLDNAGLHPSREAHREALIRRVTLDLTGLLPTIVEVDAFLNDHSDYAYEKVVDRLLASPHYGEHRGRYWLDYVRYGDTQGVHMDAYQSRWPYRDYVIRAFNNDMPFDQFTREQIAGDLLPASKVDQLIATGMIRCGIATGEAGTIIEELKCNLKRERVEALGAVYLGLTTGCAVCHDHKYDPLTAQDFYSLTAFFNNIAEKASCDDRVDWPPNILVPRPENLADYNQRLAKKASIEQQLLARRNQAPALIDAWLNHASSDSRDAAMGVSPAGLELRLRLDEADQQLTEEKQLLANEAPDAQQSHASLHGPPPHWGEDVCLWPSFRLETNTSVDAGPTGDVEFDQAFSCGGWIKPRNVPGSDSWNTPAGALISKMDKAQELRGWNIYYSGGPITVQLVHAWPSAISVKTEGTTEYRNPFRVPEGSYGGSDPTQTVPRGSWAHVFFTYDGSGKAKGLKIYVNGQLQKVVVEHDTLNGSIRTTAPFLLGRRHGGDPMQATAFQDIRFYQRELSAEEVVRLPYGDVAAEIIAEKPLPETWTLDERQVVATHFFQAVDAPSIELNAQLPRLNAELVQLSAGGDVTLVCREKPGIAYADVLVRGDYTQRSQRVVANVPHFLPPLDAKLPHNRLGLAEWIVSADNPLTARVTVNRIWQELFGTGLVTTSDDFGTVGARPSHPALLDWLAVDFQQHGWKIKRLYKQLVMSATYRQSTRVTAAQAQADPANQLLSRGPRHRLDGEVLRDCGLQASGLLATPIGGPSVKPYQPPGVWEEGGAGNTSKYVQGQGEELFRRSLYTFIKRMAPMPNLEAFDATDRSAACVARQRTNTPMAALVMMNDPQYLEIARHLGVRTLREGGKTNTSRINFLGRVLLSRTLDREEQQSLEFALGQFTEELSNSESDATALLSIGDSKVYESIPATQQAIWMMMATTVMNSDEALNK